MKTLIVTTHSAANAKFMAAFLKTVKTVKSVVIDKKSKYSESEVLEPEMEYNWINPSRPATDKEFEQMITEAEAGKSFTTVELKKRFKI